MPRKLGVLLGVLIAFSVSASAQKVDAPAAPKVQNPWFLLTGPKQVTGTKAVSTPHFNQMVTFTNTPPNGTFMVPYGSFQFTTSGQSSGSTLSFFLNTDLGNLPPGLMLNTNGVLTGTPTQVGLYSFVIFVNDQQGDFGSMRFTMTINLAVSGSPPSDVVGTPYPRTQFSATGGNAGDSYSFQVASGSGPLPTGLSLSAAGVVTGTPTVAGTFPVTIQATDQQLGFMGSATFAFVIVACSPTFLTPSGLTAADLGSPYSQAITVQGCTLPYTFVISTTSSGTTTLPPGLGLAQPGMGSSSAVISGTPTSAAGSPYAFNVTVTEANKGTATQTFSINVNPQLGFGAGSPLPPATVGQSYSQSLMPSGGTPPYSSVSLDVPPPGMTLDSPSGLLHGTPPAGSASSTPYSFTATLVDNLAAEFKKTFQLSIMTGQPSIQVAPTTLNFTAAAGGPPPANQALSITPITATSSSGATFSASIDGGQAGTNAPFTLTANPSAGAAPAQMVVKVDQGALQAGNTSGRIRIFDQNKVETDVAVNLTVTPTPVQLQVAPGRLRFAATIQSPGTFEQDLAVATAGGNSAGFSASVVNGSSWISVMGASGQTVRNSAVFVRVLVNSQGQSVGSHTDTIHFTFAGGSLDVPVSLFVRNSGPVLGVNVTGLRYRARQGGGFSGNEAVQVLDIGDPNTTVNWTAQVVSGGNIVSLGATSGTATPTQPGSLPINLAAGATQLNPGGYYALISISDPNSSNSPVYVVLVLDLAAATAPPVPDPDPTGLFFPVVAGGAQSATQSVAVNTSSATAITFQVASSTADGGSWLVVNPASGQASGSAPGSFTVAVNPANLTPGVYSGSVSISIGSIVSTIDITVVVLPPGSTVPSVTEARELPRASCTPSKLAMTEIGIANNFSVPAKWPATLIVHLNDDCANSVTSGAVVASFSNGDPPVSLLNAGQGANYSATWQPSTTASQMVVSLNASSGTLAPANLQLVGGVAANQAAAPVLAGGGTVNAFNPVSGAALSPGTIVEMFGSGLSATTTATGAPPLPVSFSGTTVLIGGLSAPLYYVSGGQLNVQIPNELPANQQYPILVSVNGAVTLPDQLDMVTLQPGVDSLTDGTLVAQHGADFSLVTATNPAKPGETLVMYLLGMGATNPPVASGQPAPSNPLAMVTVQPTVTVGGQSAHVDFAGLTPGFAGLYQVDFDVPATASSGSLPVVISQNGTVTNSTSLPVSK